MKTTIRLPIKEIKPLCIMPEKKNSIRCRTALFTMVVAAFAWTASSCVKVDISETNHPDKGKLTLITDWSNRTDGVDIPLSYTAVTDGQSVTLSGTTNEYPNLLAQGTYKFLLYNTAEHISVKGSTATVATEGDGVAAMPGWQFGGVLTQTVEQDKNYTETVAMQQLVRELTLNIKPVNDAANRIAGISATLSGITSLVNIETGEVEGTATVVHPAFSRQSDGSYSATVRLAGITGNQQQLSLTISFTEGNPATYSVTSDLTAALTGFNSDRKTPLKLTGIVTETPEESGITGTITEWKKETGNGSAK